MSVDPVGIGIQPTILREAGFVLDSACPRQFELFVVMAPICQAGSCMEWRVEPSRSSGPESWAARRSVCLYPKDTNTILPTNLTALRNTDAADDNAAQHGCEDIDATASISVEEASSPQILIMSWSSKTHHDVWNQPGVTLTSGHLLEDHQITTDPTDLYRIQQKPTTFSANHRLPFDPFDNIFIENLTAFSSMAQIQDWYSIPSQQPGGENIYSLTSTDNAEGIHDPERTSSLETTHNTITRQLRRNDDHVHKEESKHLRCFEHGCNGRRFSNKDNYRGHFRERSVVKRADCYFCDVTFSRKSNRDAHIASGRCQVVKNIFSDAVDLSQDNR
jgi:hypothetical protein